MLKVYLISGEYTLIYEVITRLSMKRFPETHQALNQSKVHEMTQFLMDKLQEEKKDEAWVRAVWQYFESYALSDVILSRLDIVWHHVFSQAQYGNNLNAVNVFIECLQNYSHQAAHSEEMKLKLRTYQDEIEQQSTLLLKPSAY